MTITGIDGLHVDFPRRKVGEGITGRAATSGEAQLVGNTLECEYMVTIPGTHAIEESLVAVPLRYGSRVIGVVLMSQLGLDQFDENDLRLLEVLAGHASVALENARLYEAVRQEAENAKAWLEFADAVSEARSVEATRPLAERSASVSASESVFPAYALASARWSRWARSVMAWPESTAGLLRRQTTRSLPGSFRRVGIGRFRAR